MVEQDKKVHNTQIYLRLIIITIIRKMRDLKGNPSHLNISLVCEKIFYAGTYIQYIYIYIYNISRYGEWPI